jgi:predicted dehydrogenase
MTPDVPFSSPTRREFLAHSAGALTAIALVPTLASARTIAAADPIKVGLVGVGRQGRAIIAELQKLQGCTVAAVCDADESRMSGGLRRVQGAEGFTDHRQMLEKRKDITAVVIATPTHLHKAIALDCLSAGRHVYCECPLAHTIEDARAIAQAAGKSDKLVFHAGLEGLSNPVYQLARTFFRSDAVRDLIAMEVQHAQKTSWRFPGSSPDREKEANWRLDPEVSIGLPGELGVHQLGAALWFTEQVPTRVSGVGAVRFHADGRTVPDTVQYDVDFASKVRLHASATLGSSYQGRREVYRGSNATIVLAWTHGWMFKEADAPTQGWEVYANRQTFHREEGITLIAGATKLAEQGKLKDGVGLPDPPLYYALSEFLASVAGGKPATVSAADGARATILAILANQAVVKGETVAVNPDLFKI